MKTITVIYKLEGCNPQQIEYSVSENFSGLWKNGKQIIGTCDFHAYNPTQLMRKLKSSLEPEIETIKKVRGSNFGW
jgi:hypothetical protein